MVLRDEIIMLESNRYNSSQSSYNESYISSLMSPLSYKINNQNLVSEHSLREIESLFMKSFLLEASIASAILAPILVPERRIWSASENSLVSAQSHCLNRTILTAKILALSKTMLPSFRIFNSQFSILNSQLICASVLLTVCEQ